MEAEKVEYVPTAFSSEKAEPLPCPWPRRTFPWIAGARSQSSCPGHQSVALSILRTEETVQQTLSLTVKTFSLFSYRQARSDE